MNVHEIRRRVMDLVPGLSDARIEPTKDGNGLYFVCTIRKMMRSVFVESVTHEPLLFGMSATVQKSDHAIAAEIVRELK